MNMTETSAALNACEKIFGSLCIALMVFVIHRNAAFFSVSDSREKLFFTLALVVLLANFSGKAGAYDYVQQAGCIQYDPVDVCGKNAELTLQSRVKGFRKTMLEELLYRDRLLVDYVDKELSIWPVRDWPFFSPFRERSRIHGAGFQGLAELEQEALSYIRSNGPVSSDTLPVDGEIFWHSSMHWSGNWHAKSKAARSVLEKRNNNFKYSFWVFDIPVRYERSRENFYCRYW